MKYKEQIQATLTANELLKFLTNTSYKKNANCRESKSHIRRFIIQTYGSRSLMALFVE